ncbi:uncharacterized protein DUF1049 [Desulfitobacterium sp. LBE]|uniref:Lipopolysaccharide assembly protein A domain-containing protein n=3 Tax=root TaxID=1 RepID=A0A0W1JL54_DESHA|nr:MULTISPECIES: LapA family protein [Desulfitobacterium]ACL22439.1 hypothetical protein Dhaf_4434 [Desulfitobacterium hafniense DCB-2]KTE92258.1 hypothetical protein AT727_04830 [Desulfitobacterium hafniense]MEA5023987.1 LapA family protein [Desulfitobacterium hafniense]TWH59777.1 uncharacterized protein DUF1049 [Desulfitobacterium sp. LBE]
MIFLIFTLLVALFVAIFAVQNAAPVAINFFWYVAEVPLVLIILGAALAGALIVFFMAIWREFRLKGTVRAQAKAEIKAKSEPQDHAVPKDLVPKDMVPTETNPADKEDTALPPG